MSKYKRFDGKGTIQTMTPYGLLLDIITSTNVKIYLFPSSYGVEYSLDLKCWELLNKKLGKQLLEFAYSEVFENIEIVKLRLMSND